MVIQNTQRTRDKLKAIEKQLYTYRTHVNKASVFYACSSIRKVI